MIVLFTDFGVTGPWVGQMKAVLIQQAPHVPVIDLMHDAPVFNPKASAWLLSACVSEFPAGTVFLCVVDPGVGSATRKPVIVSIDGRWYVGPDNGLFNVVAQQASDIRSIKWWDITWRPDRLSDTFHGRDLFAPVAAGLAVLGAPDDDMPVVQEHNVMSRIDNTWPTRLEEIIYLDSFGNAMTGVRANTVDRDRQIQIHRYHLSFARTFSEVPAGQSFWYENAIGLIEFATNSGRACDDMQLNTGDTFVIR